MYNHDENAFINLVKQKSEEEFNMEWLWTWRGRCFGYREGEDLWTYNGRHVGRFNNDEIYAPDGQYLGEIRNENRLIRNKSKKSKRGNIFTPHTHRAGYTKHADYAGYAMYAGFEDFPNLEL